MRELSDKQRTNEHPVFVRVSGVFDDGDNVCSFLGDVDQISSTAVRELHSIHEALLQ